MPVSPETATPDDVRRDLQQELAFLGFLTDEQRLCLPDWMVIAPPKTGTSWLYTNLGKHPQVYVPAVKELKYFSNRFEAEDLRGYVAHFRSGIGKAKGEASPSYSILPRRTIRLIRNLAPNLKLIFLMREPIQRAWSHARHNFRQREAYFKGFRGTIDEVSDDVWIESLNHDWNRLSGDYLGQLQRWLSVFPSAQMFLGFFEDLARSPRRLLGRVLDFLELDSEFSNSDDVTVERINIGLPRDLPPRVERHLRALYGPRIAELAEYLHREFHMALPEEWGQTTAAPIGLVDSSPSADCAVTDAGDSPQPAQRSAWEADDETLAKLLAGDDLFEMDFLGFNIAACGSEFLAYRRSLGDLKPDDRPLEWWRKQESVGNCFFADHPHDLKTMILRHCVSQAAPPGSELVRLQQVESEQDRVASRQADIRFLLREVLRRLDDIEQRQAQNSRQCEELQRSKNVAEERLNDYGDGLQEVQMELLEVHRRLDTWENSCWFRAAQWISEHVPLWRSPATSPSSLGRRSVQSIVGCPTTVGATKAGNQKPVLPGVAPSGIDRPNYPVKSG